MSSNPTSKFTTKNQGKTWKSLGTKSNGAAEEHQREGEDQSKGVSKKQTKKQKTHQKHTGKCPHSIILSISIVFVL